MKKPGIRIGCVALLLGGLGIYAVWVSLPRPKYPEQAREVLQRQQQAFSERQKLAEDRSNNGYLDSHFLGYWGRKDIEAKPGHPLLSALRPFREADTSPQSYSQQLQDPQFRAATESFHKVLPDLRKAWGQPVFLPPETGLREVDSPIPNFVAIRDLVKALVACAEIDADQGRVAQALQDQLLGLEFAHRFAEQKGNSLLDTMLGTAWQSILHAGIASVLQEPNQKWKPEELRQLQSALVNTQVSEDVVQRALEAELLLGENTFRRMGESRQRKNGIDRWGGMASFPGLLQREARLYENDFMPLLQSPNPNFGWTDHFGFGSWMLGEHGYASTILIPNAEGARRGLELTRSRQSFLHLYAGLLEFEARQQRPAASLKELQETGYQPLAGLDLNAVSYTPKAKGFQIAYTPPQKSTASEPSDNPDVRRRQVFQFATWKLPVD